MFGKIKICIFAPKKTRKVMANYIRFDWAMKRMLRNKASFGVLEGLLTTLLDEKISIVRMLESESNQRKSTTNTTVWICLPRTLRAN